MLGIEAIGYGAVAGFSGGMIVAFLRWYFGLVSKSAFSVRELPGD